MNTNILALASGLSDADLLTRIATLAANEREATVELVAHLAELDTRSSLYAAHGHGTLFTYCTEVLKLSEDAACNRISAARACRRFPGILDGLASGALSLATVRLLNAHLTPENHQAVLARASGLSRREIEALVAELAPRPDVPSSVRKLPGATPPAQTHLSATAAPTTGVKATAEAASESAPPISSPSPLPARRPIVETTSPERYRVQFTIGQESHDKLRRVQALLRREIPDGDPGAIFDHAIALLLDKVEKEKLGAATKPRTPPAIRPGTDSPALERPADFTSPGEPRQAIGMAARWRPMCLRQQGRTPMHRARLPGVPSRPALRVGRPDDRREHLAAMPAPQSVRGGAGLWSSRQGHRGRLLKAAASEAEG